MKVVYATLFTLMLSLGAARGEVRAVPGETGDTPRLQILDSGPARCASRSELCPTAGAPTTAAVAAGPGTSAPANSSADTPRFARVLSPSAAPAQRGGNESDELPWTLELHATLRHSALAGNALFLVVDAEDPKALADNEVTALWQAPIRAGSSVAARLLLSPEDGFRAQHTYRILVVQIINGAQRILAEGDVRLL